jgi:hypothetical protein
MSSVLPLLGDKRKRPEWSISAAIDPTSTPGASRRALHEAGHGLYQKRDRTDTLLAPEPDGGHEATQFSRRSGWCGCVAVRSARAAGWNAAGRNAFGRRQELDKLRAAFLGRLRELGYIEGKTVQIHERYADGVLDRLPGLARELVG